MGINCYIPTSGNCFKECITHFTKKDYRQESLAFIRTEQRRSKVMTAARIEPFCRKYVINIGCYDGFRVCPRNIAERNMALYVKENHFRLIWKTQKIIFKKTIEHKLEPNFKVVDNVISDKHVKSFVKYAYEPEKVQSQLTNMIVYDIETFNTDRAVPYATRKYRLSKISGKYNRDITEREYEKIRKDCIVFNG